MTRLKDAFIKTDSQRKWIKALDDLLPNFYKRAKEIDETRSFPFENIKELKEIGYQKVTIPKVYGGDEISLYDFVLFQERLAQGDPSTALSMGWHVGIMMDLSTKRPWKKDLFEKICGEVVQQGALINRAATEPKTGSPTRGGRPETSAKRSNDQWVIDGKKTYTTMSPMLDYFLVAASIDGSNEVGEFLIPRDYDGVQIIESWDSVAMSGTGSHDLVLNNVIVPEEFYVEKKTQNKRPQASGWLLHIPACYLGIAIAARDYALKFASEYSPNSIQGTISELPNVQRTLGQIDLELMTARHFLYSVAEKWDQSTETRDELLNELSAAKTVATNTAISVVDQAMRINGAQSLFRSNPLQRFYRDVRAGLHNPPMDDAVITSLAKRALAEIK